MAPAKNKNDEQTELLHEILLELRRLNANLEKRSMAMPPSQDMDDSDDSEELNQYE